MWRSTRVFFHLRPDFWPIFERGLAPDPAGGGHMGGSAPAVCGP